MGVDVDESVVRTRQGQVGGRVIDGVAAFRGMPYAAAPFGPNRSRQLQPSISDGRTVMRSDVHSEILDDPGGVERRLWEGIR